MKPNLSIMLGLTILVPFLFTGWIPPERNHPIRNDLLSHEMVAGRQGNEKPIPGHSTQTTTFEEIGEYLTPTHPSQIIAGRNRLYIAEGANGVEIVDITDPTSPKPIGHISLPADSIDVIGNIVYLAHGGLWIVDASDPTAYSLLGSLGDSSIDIVQAQGQFAYSLDNVPDMVFDFLVIDISDPKHPYVRSHGHEDADGLDFKVSGRYAYIAASGRCPLYAYNISNPDHIIESDTGLGEYEWANVIDAENDVFYFHMILWLPGEDAPRSYLDTGTIQDFHKYIEILDQYQTISPITALAVSDESLYMYTDDEVLTLFSVKNPLLSSKDPGAIYEEYSQPIGWNVHDMKVVGNLIYLATDDGVHILRYVPPPSELYLPMLIKN